MISEMYKALRNCNIHCNCVFWGSARVGQPARFPVSHAYQMHFVVWSGWLSVMWGFRAEVCVDFEVVCFSVHVYIHYLHVSF